MFGIQFHIERRFPPEETHMHLQPTGFVIKKVRACGACGLLNDRTYVFFSWKIGQPVSFDSSWMNQGDRQVHLFWCQMWQFLQNTTTIINDKMPAHDTKSLLNLLTWQQLSVHINFDFRGTDPSLVTKRDQNQYLPLHFTIAHAPTAQCAFSLCTSPSARYFLIDSIVRYQHHINCSLFV